MIDIDECKKVFFDYIKNYDMSDPKINLKVVHTLHVMETASYISDNLGLDDENKNLALLIALLHDIGRFDQLILFGTFEDKKSFDHADYGVKLLFEDGLIRDYISTDIYDDIIYKAIKNHNKYAIDSELNDQELLHAKLIRDADKLDNFRVQDTEEMRTLLDKSESEIGKQSISSSVIDDFMSGKLVNRKNTNNEIDRWISYIACIFDINYNASLNFLLNKKYIEKLFNRIPYTNPDTIKQVEKLKSFVSSYINKKLSEELVGNYGK